MRKYVIEMRSELSTESTDFEVVGIVPATETFIRLSNLAPGRLFWLRIRAFGDFGISDSFPTQELLTHASIPSQPSPVRLVLFFLHFFFFFFFCIGRLPQAISGERYVKQHVAQVDAR